MSVRLSTGSLASTSNWQFFSCPVIKACLDCFKAKDKRIPSHCSQLKKALVANDILMVADALEKEKHTAKSLNRRLLFSWGDMYTVHITPLCVAVFYRNMDIIQLLCKNGSSPKRGGQLFLRNSRKHCTIVARISLLLLSLEDQPDCGCPFVETVASALLDAGADINETDGFVFWEREEEGGSMEFDNHITPLHFFACRHRHANLPTPSNCGHCLDSKQDSSESGQTENSTSISVCGNSWGSHSNKNNRESVSCGTADEGINLVTQDSQHWKVSSGATLDDNACCGVLFDQCSSYRNTVHQKLYVQAKAYGRKGETSRDKNRSEETSNNCASPFLESETVFYFLLEKGSDMFAMDATGTTPLESLLKNLTVDCQQECKDRMLMRALELIRRGGFINASDFPLAVFCPMADILLEQLLNSGYLYTPLDLGLVTHVNFQKQFGPHLSQRLSGHWVPDLKHLCRQKVRDIVCCQCCRRSDWQRLLGLGIGPMLGTCCIKKLQHLPLPQPLVDFISLKP